jgi:hypothetical protein
MYSMISGPRMPHQFFDRHHGGEEDITVAVSILEWSSVAVKETKEGRGRGFVVV